MHIPEATLGRREKNTVLQTLLASTVHLLYWLLANESQGDMLKCFRNEGFAATLNSVRKIVGN